MVKPKPPQPSTGCDAGLTPDDALLFRDAVGKVKSLPDPGRIVAPPARALPVPRRRAPEHTAAPDRLTDHVPHSVESEDDNALGFLRPGVTPQTLRRLRRGHWPIQDEIDLHGLTRDRARTRLVTFLEICLHRDIKCIRIIHGKGFGSKNQEPVLKQLVKSWLMQRPEVQAFIPARPEDGGAGALRVLLKRGSKNRLNGTLK